MKIRPIQPQPEVPYHILTERLQECTDLVRAYHKARIARDLHTAHAARLEISLFVPGGVYKRGGPGAEEYFAVYGTILRPGKKLPAPERLFIVPMIPIKEARQTLEVAEGGSVGKWAVSLVDTEGFLTPICRDGYHGPRFIRVGEIVHH